jgi:hypothetical protein
MTFGTIGRTVWSYQWLRAPGRSRPRRWPTQLADLALVGLVVR